MAEVKRSRLEEGIPEHARKGLVGLGWGGLTCGIWEHIALGMPPPPERLA